MDRKEGQTLFEVTPEISHFAELCEKNNAIDKELYTKYEVKRGLRDLNGKGVLAGLTNISDVCAKKIVNGDRKSTRLNSSHSAKSRMPSSA